MYIEDALTRLQCIFAEGPRAFNWLGRPAIAERQGFRVVSLILVGHDLQHIKSAAGILSEVTDKLGQSPADRTQEVLVNESSQISQLVCGALEAGVIPDLLDVGLTVAVQGRAEYLPQLGRHDLQD